MSEHPRESDNTALWRFGLTTALITLLLVTAGCDARAPASPPTAHTTTSQTHVTPPRTPAHANTISPSLHTRPPLHVKPAVVLGDASEDEGAALALERECHRCHEVPTLEPPPAHQRCVSCHQQHPTRQLRAAPSLRHLGHLRERWLIDYLLRPHRLRPHQRATMPRIPLTRDEARQLARFLQRRASPHPDLPRTTPGDPRRGCAVARRAGCATCHDHTGGALAHPRATPAPATATLAIDLRHTRARMSRDALVAWLRAPRTLRPHTTMPDLHLSAQDARDIASCLLDTPQRAVQRPPRVQLPPVTIRRQVRWPEVSRRVFAKTCAHCHAPDLPGHDGGLGFAAIQLDLTTRAGARRGARREDGTRLDVLKPAAPGKLPPLVEALRARHDEAAGHPTGATRGMPLGHAPLPLDQIQLVRAWIRQGAR